MGAGALATLAQYGPSAVLLFAFEEAGERVQGGGDVGHVPGGAPFGQAAAEGGDDEQGDLVLVLAGPVWRAPASHTPSLPWHGGSGSPSAAGLMTAVPGTTGAATAPAW